MVGEGVGEGSEMGGRGRRGGRGNGGPEEVVGVGGEGGDWKGSYGEERGTDKVFFVGVA